MVKKVDKVEKHTSYLDELVIPETLETGFIAAIFKNIRLPLLMTAITLVIGLVSYMTLSRELNPSINIPIVSVVTALPGASPQDVESLITIPLEDSIRSVSGIDTITSSSQENVSVISMQFVSGTNPDKAKTDVQSAVDNVKSMPTDAQKSSVSKLDFQDQPVWTFAIASNTDPASLMVFADRLKDKIRDSSRVDRVNMSGYADQEIRVLIKPEELRSRKLSALSLSQVVQSAIGSYPAGNIQASGTSFALSLDPTVSNVSNLRNVKITSGGSSFMLGDIAQIELAPKPSQNTSFYADPKTPASRTVTFSVYKTKASNIDASVKDVRAIVDTEIGAYKNQFKLVNILDGAKEVDDQFNELAKSFMETIVLIFIVLFIFLGIRQAALASFIIPVVLLATFAIMKTTGITLNFISLFSLLIALGLLVDDTIVIISAVTMYYNSGRFTPREAALLVFRDFLTPIVTTTITKVWAFLPLLLSTGIIGEFIKPIPIVVSASLIASAFISMLITLPIMMLLLRPTFPKRVKVAFAILGVLAVIYLGFTLIPQSPLFPITFVVFLISAYIAVKVRKDLTKKTVTYIQHRAPEGVTKESVSRIFDRGIIDAHAWGNKYRVFIEKVLSSKSARRKGLIAVLLFFVFSILLLPLGFVVNEFFPKSNGDTLYINAELPAGTSVQKTQSAMNDLLNKVRKEKYVDHVVAETGTNVSSMGGGGGGSNKFLLTISMEDHKVRKASSDEIEQHLRNTYGDYGLGTLTVQGESSGPPAGADLQIKLVGSELSVLNQYTDKVVTYLEKKQGVTNVSKSVKPGTGKLVFVPDAAKMNEAGIAENSIGLSMRTVASGFKLDDITIENKKYDITFRMFEDTPSAEDMGSIMVSSQNGDYALNSLGDISLEYNPTVITRESGKRTMSVSAGVQKGYATSVLNEDLLKYANSLSLPTGYSWKTGGVNEENSKSVSSILQAMGLSVILILTTMVVEFGSFRKALIVICVIPLAISGVFVIFGLTGTPLSFPALIGVLALFGIVVNNSIVLVDKIDLNLKNGFALKTAISEASASRMEPILLTSFCAIAGLIPITISDPVWRGLGGAIISGLTFSGAIMLIFIPIVFYVWFRDEYEGKEVKG